MHTPDNDNDDRPPDFIENSPLLRQLFYDRRFRFGAVALILFVAGLAVSIPKIWVITPAGVEPQMRVSLMGKLQSVSLARTAANHAAAERWEDSVWTWRAALQHNPGNLTAVRGFLETLARQPDPQSKYFDFATSEALWLLRMGNTNAADLALSVQVFQHYDSDASIVGLLTPMAASLPPASLVQLAMANFRLGNIGQFTDYQQRIGSNAPAGGEWSLYKTAWKWGWGPVDGSLKARQDLEQAAQNPAQASLAWHLWLQVAFAKRDPAEFQSAFTKIQQLQTDQPIDHANYWDLLAETGRRAEAIEMAKNYSAAPKTVNELIMIATEMGTLGLAQDAAALLQKHRAQFSRSSELWSRLGELYIESKEWEKLREMAIDMRADTTQMTEIPGYGWYLEGVANLKLGAQENARQNFAKAAETTIKPPMVAFRTASGMSKLGYPEPAAKIFARLDQWFAKNEEYWFSLALAAYQSGDFDLFMSASRKAYELAPKRLAVINNLAASYLLLRQQPAEAVRLTLECIAVNPGNPGFRINHALALVLNGQGAEADKVLKELDPSRLPLEERSLFHYARFQIYFAGGQTEPCRQEVKDIEMHFLKAEQSKWMKTAMQEIGAPAKGI